MRKTKYLRISVTDVCNQSCFFCHREGNLESGIPLTTSEIVFVCEAARDLGFVKFKLTGGEPTLREDLIPLVENLVSLNLTDLSMITNGTTLKTLAAPLWKAGLRRLNITVNTLNEKRYKNIHTGRHAPFVSTAEGIDAALKTGFKNIKLNFVYANKDSGGDLRDILAFSSSRFLTMVLLPVMMDQEKNRFDLPFLYKELEQIGIRDEKLDRDAEGIKRLLITMKSGANVLLRQDELGSIEPYIFCSDCTEKKKCREGIFPLRLSAYGALLPCLASGRRRIDLKTSITNRDKHAVTAAVKQIWAWQHG